MLLRLCTALALAGCVASESTSESTAADAPLVGVDGSLDQADRNCHVVLRGMERNWTGISWETGPSGASWIWQGTLEVSEVAAAEGLVPRVLYTIGNNPQWLEVTATPIELPGTPGYKRYTVRISDGLPGPGWSGSAIASAKIHVVPFLALGEGGRLFDHNRNSNDLDNYEIVSPDFAVWGAPGVCTPPSGSQRAKVVFAADFSETREGVLAPGGELTIAYDPARLPHCRHWRNGNALYDITAHLLFEPDGERRDVSVRDGAPTISVPPTARTAVLWFENTDASGCHEWDSNLGDNYRFDALVPPQWVGDVRTLITRGGSDACDGGGSASSGFVFDTWARQRAAITNVCFSIYQPGLTDRDDPALWQKLDVSVRWRFAGQPSWQTRSVDFDRRDGNNARYRVSLRDFDPFRSYHCPDAAPGPASDPQYVQLPFEYYVVVNGGETRPVPGGAFGGRYLDYAQDAWRAANCAN